MGEIRYLDNKSRHLDALMPNCQFLRKVTPNDQQKFEANQERAKQAAQICRQKITIHNLGMYLVESVFSFDGTCLNFVFTAEDRVDFRELVKDLANHFKKQIHLQQIGPRDKAQIMGGCGRCGHPFCCANWLPKLESVSMDMARVQNIANKGSEKLSGVCGKLLCCLRYEVHEYTKLKEELPPIGAMVSLKGDEKAEIISMDILNKKLKVRIDQETVRVISAEEIVKILSVPKNRDFEAKESIVSEPVAEMPEAF